MTMQQNDKMTLQKPLRLWPGVVLIIVGLLLRYVLPLISPDAGFYGVMGYLLCAVLVAVWWLFFSRAPWLDRILGVVLMALAVFVVSRLVHVSIAKGAMGMLYYLFAIPLLALVFVVWAVVSRNWSNRARRVSMVLAIFLALTPWLLLRTGGFTGEFDNDFSWRWTETPEERLLAKHEKLPAPPAASAPAAKTPGAPVPAPTEEKATQPAEETTAKTEAQTTEPSAESPAPPVAAETTVAEAEWPGFRGPERNGIIHGVRIKSDWNASPPVELWRKSIGPAWSSFAVQGDKVFTQEQRGEEELVSCYNATNGEPVWVHRDPVRFWESNAGAGPRGTPTIHNGRVYAFGATGLVNSLNAADGSLLWSRDAQKDTGAKLPGWGFSSSPLVTDDVVVVAASGRLIAYDIQTGEPRWKGPEGGTDYSSPQLMKLGGVQQVLFMNNPGAMGVVPASGKVLWKYSLPSGTRIIQPAMTADGDVLVTDGDRKGMRRITVTNGNGQWNVKERWASIGLKPYFSDFVVHKGHAYGFDGANLSCIDLNNGERKWKGGKYGHGQMILLADQDLLLILSEKGELALVNATTDEFKEIAKRPAIEGKTWNHPVLVRDTLLVRNGEEMVAYRLALAD